MNYRRIKLAEMDPEQVTREIGDFIIKEITNIGRSGGVIGLSGGVDSTTTAALAQRAFKKYNALTPRERYDKYKATNPKETLELVGYMLPSKVNNPKDTEDAIKIAKKLHIRYELKSISKIVDAYVYTNPEIFNVKNDFHKGNLMARIRANVLSTKAAIEDKLVIGTGNKDEDFGIGYFTLFGDGAVHLSPIGNLPKRLVRQMAEYHNFKDLANRIPAAGLEPGQTDFKDLGYKYDTVEVVIEGKLQKFSLEELFSNYQVNELAKEDIEEYKRLFWKEKFSSVEEIVSDVLRRNKIAEGKAKIVHPPIAPITLIYK